MGGGEGGADEDTELMMKKRKGTRGEDTRWKDLIIIDTSGN